MPKTTIWVLIADGTRARLLGYKGGKVALKPAMTQEFIGTNLPSRAIASDRAGRALGSDRSASHAVQPRTDPHRHEEEAFAREIADTLEKARKRKAFDQLIVVAPPKTLGDLRAAFTKPLQARIKAELNKDLTTVPVHALPKHLGSVLR